VKRVWDALKKWGAAILAALLFVVGAGWLWNRRKARRIADALAVEKATKEIERLRATRAQLVERLGEKDEAIEEIDAAIEDNKADIVAAYEDFEEMTTDEVADVFRRLGL
jgi:predicted RNA polymerase sigma factor